MEELARFHWLFFENYKIPVANFDFYSNGRFVTKGSFGPKCYGDSFIEESGSSWGSEDCKLFGRSFVCGDVYLSNKTTIKNTVLSGSITVSSSHIHNSKIKSKSKDAPIFCKDSIVANSKVNGRASFICSKIFGSELTSSPNDDPISIKDTIVRQSTITEFVIIDSSFVENAFVGNRSEIVKSTFKGSHKNDNGFYILPTFSISESNISFSKFVGGAEINCCKAKYVSCRGERIILSESSISGKENAIIRFFDGVFVKNSEFITGDIGYSVGISKRAIPIGAIGFTDAKIISCDDFFIYELFDGIRVLYRRKLDLVFTYVDSSARNPDELQWLMLKRYGPLVNKLCELEKYKSSNGYSCLWLKWFVFSNANVIDSVIVDNAEKIESAIGQRFSVRTRMDLFSILRFNMAEAAEKICNIKSKGIFYRPWKGGKSSKQAIENITPASIDIRGKNFDISKKVVLTNETIRFLSRETYFSEKIIKKKLCNNKVDFVIIR